MAMNSDDENAMVIGATTSVSAMGFRMIGGYLYRSTDTIHRYFFVVLNVILKLYPDLIHFPHYSTPSEIRGNPRYYPWFADCVGAIDGTHVRASVPLEIQGRFHGRKGFPTQNVLAAISFDLKFSYVLAGWEGCGLWNSQWFYSSISWSLISLKEYDDNPPQNEKELFNLLHSSLRTTIERGFVILKKRFRVLDNDPFWKYKTQVYVVLACCILHNHIVGVGLEPNDTFMEEVINEEQSQNSTLMPNVQLELSQRERRAENREWARKRNEIAHAMFADYTRR
ncbi:hypothetical protein ACH5RR_015535 [Cinchona calisaya]|uniref:DDE Tnp4 domain-containing protein n=1 Tax=Cinchona calisaya TaxID=153742 RepID=A0ABD2ZVB3_9GENT